MEILLTGTLIFWFIGIGLLIYNTRKMNKILYGKMQSNKKLKSDIEELRSMIKLYKKAMK